MATGRSTSRSAPAVVHHTAESNDYPPQDSAGIVQSIYAYHTQILGWCDIAYNALVDKYGQVFEGRAGALIGPVQGDHTGGFNSNTWGVAMIGNFDDVPRRRSSCTPSAGCSAGGSAGPRRPQGHGRVDLGRRRVHQLSRSTPSRRCRRSSAHRDVGATDCPGNVAYGLLDEIRDTAAHFSGPPRPEDLAMSLQGGAIYDRWQAIGGMSSVLGAPTSPEATGAGAPATPRSTRARCTGPRTGAQPVTGAIYDAWATLGYERGALGLPTSAEFQEPQWVKQNFQHGTLNFDRLSGRVTRVDRRRRRGTAAAVGEGATGSARAVLARGPGGLTPPPLQRPARATSVRGLGPPRRRCLGW